MATFDAASDNGYLIDTTQDRTQVVQAGRVIWEGNIDDLIKLLEPVDKPGWIKEVIATIETAERKDPR